MIKFENANGNYSDITRNGENIGKIEFNEGKKYIKNESSINIQKITLNDSSLLEELISTLCIRAKTSGNDNLVVKIEEGDIFKFKTIGYKLNKRILIAKQGEDYIAIYKLTKTC